MPSDTLTLPAPPVSRPRSADSRGRASFESGSAAGAPVPSWAPPLCLVHHPVGNRMTQVVKPVTMTLRNRHSGLNCGLAQMIRSEDTARQRRFTLGLEGGEHEIRIPPIGRPGPPRLKVPGKARVQRHVPVAALCLGRPVLAA
jgi:hypothetical protein